MIPNNYPYTDFHGLNLDWIIKKVKEVDEKVNDAFYDTIREYISQMTLDSVYDEATETLTLVLTAPEG
jgi:hypothetical protein